MKLETVAFGWAIGAFWGCTALPVSTLVRGPVDDQCQAHGLKGCPELVDGAVAYLEGDKARAARKLRRAGALNSPEQLQQFAGALRRLGAASDAGKPLVEVAALLAEQQPVTPTPVVVAPAPVAAATTAPTIVVSPPIAERPRGPTPEQLALLALTAQDDPMRLVTESVGLASPTGMECEVAGSPAVCIRRKQGPLVVTDVVASEECAGRALLVAADTDTPAFGLLWALPARAPGVQGGRFAVGGGQWLFVAVKAPSKPQASDRGCFLTWSGFRPRFVPSPVKDPGF